MRTVSPIAHSCAHARYPKAEETHSILSPLLQTRSEVKSPIEDDSVCPYVTLGASHVLRKYAELVGSFLQRPVISGHVLCIFDKW